MAEAGQVPVVPVVPVVTCVYLSFPGATLIFVFTSVVMGWLCPPIDTVIAIDDALSIWLVGTSESRRIITVPLPEPVIFSRVTSVPAGNIGLLTDC